MKHALRSKRSRPGFSWAAGMIFVFAALMISCAGGADQPDGATFASASVHTPTPTSVSAPDVGRGRPDILLYFLASPRGGSRSADAISSVFRTVSGSTVDVWRDAEPTRTIAFDEIKALRIREGRPSPSLFAPTDYVIAEIEIDGSKAKSFRSLIEEEGDAFLLIAAGERAGTGEDDAIDFLPIAIALRPSGERASNGVWVSAGTFGNRLEAEAFFGDLGDRPRVFIALSETERAAALTDTRRLIDYAIWESVCDPTALAQFGDDLAQRLSELPDYEERARGMDCRVRPELGGDFSH